jgi:hypothetical protein
MNIRGLLVAALVLIALTGTLYWSNHHQNESTPSASAAASPKIMNLPEADISAIDLRKKDGSEVAVGKDSSGKWQITRPTTLAADATAVSGVLSTLSSLSSERVVEDHASNLSPYGLSQPSLEAEVTEKDNRKQKLLIGDDTPTGSAAYAKLDGDPRVFTLPSYEKTSLDKGVADLRDRRLLNFDSDKISGLKLTSQKQTIEFGRSKDEWQILKPKPLRADNSQVEALIRTLGEAKMELGGPEDDEKIAAAFRSAAPVAIATVTDGSGTQELEVRKHNNDGYAKSTAVAGVYKVASSLAQGLDKNLDDFRNKKLFDFGFDDPNKIEIHSGPKAFYLTRSGEVWWSGAGKKIDAGGAQSLIDKLRDLSSAKLADSGYSSPDLRLVVTSNDGKRMETVLISKHGSDYVAKRENEPALYQLDGKSIDDLEKDAEAAGH